mmetsp:Transcript_70941/g.198937  ORF Transcript_70941/g.198937 Transcript_70941/m.198937 type:complete len:219 (-) Transcript_70941:223-879(-)
MVAQSAAVLEAQLLEGTRRVGRQRSERAVGEAGAVLEAKLGEDSAVLANVAHRQITDRSPTEVERHYSVAGRLRHDHHPLVVQPGAPRQHHLIPELVYPHHTTKLRRVYVLRPVPQIESFERIVAKLFEEQGLWERRRGPLDTARLCGRRRTLWTGPLVSGGCPSSELSSGHAENIIHLLSRPWPAFGCCCCHWLSPSGHRWRRRSILFGLAARSVLP